MRVSLLVSSSCRNRPILVDHNYCSLSLQTLPRHHGAVLLHAGQYLPLHLDEWRRHLLKCFRNRWDFPIAHYPLE